MQIQSLPRRAQRGQPPCRQQPARCGGRPAFPLEALSSRRRPAPAARVPSPKPLAPLAHQRRPLRQAAAGLELWPPFQRCMPPITTKPLWAENQRPTPLLTAKTQLASSAAMAAPTSPRSQCLAVSTVWTSCCQPSVAAAVASAVLHGMLAQAAAAPHSGCGRPRGGSRRWSSGPTRRRSACRSHRPAFLASRLRGARWWT